MLSAKVNAHVPHLLPIHVYRTCARAHAHTHKRAYTQGVGGLSAQDKCDRVRLLQRGRGFGGEGVGGEGIGDVCVAMVGDGVNDALALSQVGVLLLLSRRSTLTLAYA